MMLFLSSYDSRHFILDFGRSLVYWTWNDSFIISKRQYVSWSTLQEKVLLEESISLQILPNELRISNLRQADMGDYICSAKNREGTVTATTKVIVAGPAAITGPPRNLTILEGAKTELSCLTKALPSNVTHRWFQNGSEIQNINWMSSRTTIKRDGTLVLNPTTAEDSGIFTCEVSNGKCCWGHYFLFDD